MAFIIFFFFFWKHCRKFPHFFGIFDDFVYCWTFEILHLHICLLLNLWTFFTTEPLRLSVAAESLDFLYCWTFEIICCCWTFGFSLLLNLWDYALDYVSVYCWTFGFYLLLNLWNYLFASEPLDFLYCWTFGFFNKMSWIRNYRYFYHPCKDFKKIKYIYYITLGTLTMNMLCRRVLKMTHFQLIAWFGQTLLGR